MTTILYVQRCFVEASLSAIRYNRKQTRHPPTAGKPHLMTPLRLAAAFAVSLLTTAFAIAQGFSPTEAVKRMKLPDGFTVRCVASEPMIRQPVSMSFDERGRLWVLQYLQYPNPAGLKPVKQDQYLRTIYDRVPEPPPAGPK
jgi:hypothetical protein